MHRAAHNCASAAVAQSPYPCNSLQCIAEIVKGGREKGGGYTVFSHLGLI